MQVGLVEVGRFRQITRCISKTAQDVQNKRIVSNEDENEIICALSNGDIAEDTG